VAVAGADPVQAALLTARIFLRQGLDGEALERFDAACARLEGQPWSAGTAQALAGRARALLNLGRLAEAVEAAGEVRDRLPDDRDNLQVLGESLLLGGAAEDAMRVLSHAAGLAPRDPAVLRHLGRAARAAGRRDDAERALRRAVELDGDFVAARVELGRLLLEVGRVEDAIRESRAALDVLPTYGDAAYLLAVAQRRAGVPGEAMATLIDLLEGDPYHLDGLVLLGQVLNDQGRRDDARRALQRVLRLNRDRADAHFHLGVVASEERRFRDAVAHWRDAIDLQPDGPFVPAARENISMALDVARLFHTDAAVGV
jgi:tetratricopeptide (TPR) repeat protein